MVVSEYSFREQVTDHVRSVAKVRERNNALNPSGIEHFTERFGSELGDTLITLPVVMIIVFEFVSRLLDPVVPEQPFVPLKQIGWIKRSASALRGSRERNIVIALRMSLAAP